MKTQPPPHNLTTALEEPDAQPQQTSVLRKSLLTPADLVHRLNVSLATVYRLIERRLIGFVRVGGRLRFRESDIEAYIDSQFVRPLS